MAVLAAKKRYEWWNRDGILIVLYLFDTQLLVGVNMIGVKIAEFTSVVAVFLFAAFMVFQVIVPLLKGTQIFPFLFSDRKKAYDKLTAAREEQEVDAIETAAAELSGNAPTKSKRR